MISLTETAADKVKELLAAGSRDFALRVAVQPGGCSGLRYAMYLDDQVSERDATAEHFGVRIVIDKMSAPYLSEATAISSIRWSARASTIDNPATQGGCACGQFPP